MNNDDEYIEPPGTMYDIINHPSGKDEAIEISLMKDHRFAFYFWYKWQKKREENLGNGLLAPPALVSIDWHQDLCQPCDIEKEDLLNLDLNSYKKVALFCWDKLNPLNDGHILAAAYLNLIGDVYVLCKQGDEIDEPDFIDYQGNTHKINCYYSSKSLISALQMTENENIYFDIDLDYFTESEDFCGGGEDLKLVEDKEISDILNHDTELMIWLHNRMSGMTIATEPEFCGGLSNSNKIFNTVDKVLFASSLFSKKTTWKHLK